VNVATIFLAYFGVQLIHQRFGLFPIEKETMINECFGCLTYFSSLESTEEILQYVEVKSRCQDPPSLRPFRAFATQQSRTNERMQKFIDETFRRMLRTSDNLLDFVGLDALIGQHAEHPVAP
jgi:hypothetical protein